MGFSALWDGYYAFNDQQLYAFNITSNRLNADFWLDDQQFSQMLGTTQSNPYNAFPLNNFYAVLLNQAPVSGNGLNHLRLAMGGTPQNTSLLSFASQWAPLGQIGQSIVYQANFLDSNGNLISSATDSLGAGETQTMCVGAGCPVINSIPSNTCRIVIVASPIGDPLGTYNGTTPASSTIDLIATLTNSYTGSTQMADFCVNGQCSTNVIDNASSQVVLNSNTFVTYNNNTTDPTQNQGLFSQQANTIVITFRGNGAAANPPYADCLGSSQLAGQTFTATLGYQQHQW
jgi:hypothetical protein